MVDRTSIRAIVVRQNNRAIIDRLEVIKSIVFDNGGDKHSFPQDDALINANELLESVIKAVEQLCSDQSTGDK